VFYWIVAAFTILLLFASFTGDGRGVGIMTHMAWSYAFGIGLLGLVAWVAARSSGTSTQTDPAQGHTKEPQSPSIPESTRSPK
jgi:hypothetical protein